MKSPHGLRMIEVGGNQGRVDDCHRLATIACYWGLWLWITAPIRLLRRVGGKR